MDESKLDHALELVTNLDTTKEQHESSDIVMLSEEGRVSSELN